MSGQLPKMLPAYGGHGIGLHIARFADIPAGDDRLPFQHASTGRLRCESCFSSARPQQSPHIDLFCGFAVERLPELCGV